MYSHIKVVVISEDLLRLHSLEALLDLIFRDNELRASCLVLISKGFASKILESNAKGGFPSFELIGILDNKNRSTRILPSVTVANLTGKMGSKSSFLIQNVSSAKGEIKVTGGSIIKGKNKKIVGYFNAKEIDGLTWITGQGKRGLVRIYEEETGQPIVYEIKSMKSKIIPHVRGKNISFNVNIESEGRISENWLTSQRKMTNEFLKKIEKEAEKEVNLIVNNVLEKAQKEYQVDVFGFGNKMRIEYPKTWEKLKGNWDKTFSEIPIKCKVKLIIKDYGGER
ncbi:spore gernimation protein GerC [Bacillus cereus]|nr:spore gernimation protein GerC [Bacillus cereus]